MSGGICVWTGKLTGWKTSCGGRVKETPREGKPCPWCGNRIVLDVQDVP